MFVWKEKRYLYSEGTVGASLNETRSAYKSEKQTSVEDLLQKKKEKKKGGFKDFGQRYFITKKYLLMEVLFCLIHRKSSSGVRLHTQNTKKWTGVRRLEVWPVVSDEGEDERWTPWLSSSEATAEGEGRDGQRGLNLVTPVLHLQLRQSSAYSPTETARTLQFYWFLLCL